MAANSAGLGSALIARVGELMRRAADQAILPRYRRLQQSEVEEKSPGEVVTVADRDCERLLTRELLELYPGSRAVGEEACAVNPNSLGNLGEGVVWLVDPLDGTSNFAAGRGPFAVMVALLKNGTCVASWMLDPLGGSLCTAELGSGAFRDGSRVMAEPWHASSRP